MRHKHLTFVLAMLMSITAGMASAHDFKVDGIYYNITSSSSPYTVEVTYRGEYTDSYSNEYTGSVAIPESVTYKSTTYSVTSIGAAAFYECSGLTSINIPNSVTSISGSAFIGCIGLETIVIDSDNTVYDSREGCNAIIETSSNTLILGCKNTIIPNSVTSIGECAFENCSSLTSVSIPNSVTSIGNSAFHGTAWYDNQPDGLVYAGKVVYKYKGTMPEGTSIVLEEGTLGIADYAFSSCSGLTSITIPNSVISIGRFAFYLCKGLTSVTIPNSVTSIGTNPFSGCRGLETIVVNSGNTVYDSREGCNAIIETAFNTLIAGCKNTIIPNNVTSIGDYAFEYCTGLTSVTIPNSVETIGVKAFRHCESLTSIVIPGSVKTLEEGIFSECYNLTTAVIEEGVETIGRGVFYMAANNKLASISIPSSVTSLGRWPFYGCTNLTRINCRATTPPSCEESSLQYVPEDCTIEVPMCCKAAYEAVSPWNRFTIVETEDPAETTIVTLTAEYGTFCSTKALDFTGVEGLRAYIASAYDSERGVLTLTRVYNVKARTGLILRGTKGETYEIPEGTGATTVANMLVGVVVDTELNPTDGRFTNFILAKDDIEGIGFYKVAHTSTLKAGKAYLQLPTDDLGSEVKGFRMMFDEDMSDGVETIHNSQCIMHNEAGAVYDLQGRRVAKPTKGIYIVNGKKTVVK